MPRWQPHEKYFWSLAIKATSGCWVWIGSLDSKGYGRVEKDGKRQAAHRVAYEYAIGSIPKGMLACHSCDNKLCVRPDHIFIGTQVDNMQDWTKKGKNRLVNDPSLWRRGDQHWTRQKTKKTEDGLRSLSERRKAEWASGKRTAIRDAKGRIMGTKMTVKA